MSLKLLFIMTALLLADYVVGLLYGIWNEGFDREKCIKGAQKYFLIFVGYGAIALIAYISSMRLAEMEYLSGLLLEPIARYFIKLLDRMKGLMAKDTEREKKPVEIKSEKPQETVVTVQAVKPEPAKPAPKRTQAARRSTAAKTSTATKTEAAASAKPQTKKEKAPQV